MSIKKLALAASAVIAAVAPLSVQAESNLATGGGALSASARVNFSIVIPRFLFLQVGTGTLLANVGTIDTISFAPAVGAIGNATPVAGTGGNLTGGAVTVRILGNTGAVTLGAIGTTALNNGSGDTIPWTQIGTAVTGGATHPAIDGATVPFPATGNVVNVAGTWTYTYLNTITPAAGTFTGQVTYTATSP